MAVCQEQWSAVFTGEGYLTSAVVKDEGCALRTDTESRSDAIYRLNWGSVYGGYDRNRGGQCIVRQAHLHPSSHRALIHERPRPVPDVDVLTVSRHRWDLKYSCLFLCAAGANEHFQ